MTYLAWRIIHMKLHTIDLNFLGQQNGIASFLIETSLGPVLVESGPHSTVDRIDAKLKELGYSRADVKHVFLTHIHLDHAGAAWCFADHGAKVYLHPRGYRHMHNPERLLNSAKMIYKEKMDYLWGTLRPISEDLLVTVDHKESIEIAEHTFKAHHTPGHAQHHIAWQVGNVVFTGDVAGVCINQGPVIPPCPPPDINREAWISSIDYLRTLKEVDTYYLTHFGRIENIEIHLDRLKEAIRDYTDFVKPYAEERKPIGEWLGDFQKFVMNYLISHGLNKKDANAYEAANPSDMSATGLLRYWTKKFEVQNG